MNIYLDTRKDGKRARSRGWSPEIIFALLVAYDVFREHGQKVAISCGSDGEHTLQSRHYSGDAVDIRRPQDATKIVPIVSALSYALGEDYQTIVEDTHIHIQYRPEGALNL